MIRAACLGAALVAATTLPSVAQSTFERLEAVAVAMNEMMFDAMVEETPALEGNMPTAAWSDDLRTAYTCMYDGYVAEAGEEAIAVMVTSMEETLATATAAELLAGDASAENPEGISDERALEIVGGCGMMEAFMDHMTASGAMQILMDP
jgi:hypothetical protein